MGHFNRNNGNRNGNRNSQRGGHGPQAGGPLPLPEAFNKGEIIDGLVFSMVPKRDGSGTHVAAVLTDGTHVVPGTYGDYRFVPVLDEKGYLCSVMGSGGNCSGLPVYHRELTKQEWVHEAKPRAPRTQHIEDLVFDWSDERNTDRQPRLMSHSQDGHLVLVERGYENRVQPGVVTRVSLVEARNGRSNVLFAIPLAVQASKPAQQQNGDSELAPPVQPDDPLKVTLRSFERKQNVLTVRSVADVNVRDKQLSIYELLSDGRLGIQTTPTTPGAVVRDNARRIANALDGTIRKDTPRVIRENTLARIDAIGEAMQRAVAAHRALAANHGNIGVNAEAVVSALEQAANGDKPKRRKRNRRNRNRNRDGQVSQSQPRPNVVRPQGTATIGDAIGNALTKEVEVRSVPTVDPFDTSEITTVTAADIEDVTDDEGDDEPVDVTDSDDVIVTAEAPAPAADEYEDAYVGMARELRVTVEVLKAAIVKSGLSAVDFSEKPKNMKMFYVREVNAEKSA